MENKKNRLALAGIAILLICIVFGSQNAAAAETQNIHPSASAQFTPSTSFNTIKTAIEGAYDGDVFTFADGAYVFSSSITITAKNVTIRGQSQNGTHFSLENTGYRHFAVTRMAENTTFEHINMFGHGPVYYGKVNGGIDAGSDIILNDMRISDCSTSSITTSEHGGAIRSDALVTMTDTILFNNYAYGSGGGLSTSKNAEFNNCTIEHNIARLGDGGGIYAKGNLTINGGSITDNQAWNMFAGNGGGAYVEGSIESNDAVIEKNISASAGGGLYSNTLTIEGGSVHDNKALHGNGGGIVVSGPLTLDDYHEIYNNTAGTYGGGIYGESTISLTNSTLHDNKAYNGGGVYAERKLTVDSSTINNNKADGNGGGLNAVSEANLVNTTLYANESAAGGGIYAQADASLANCTVTLNTGNPGGIFVGSDSYLQGNIISGNGSNNSGSEDVNGVAPTMPTSPAYNLIGLPDGITLADIFDSPDPTLEDNGGKTETVMISDDSYALDVLPSGSGYPSKDQRGNARPQNDKADAGSVEIMDDNTVPPDNGGGDGGNNGGGGGNGGGSNGGGDDNPGGGNGSSGGDARTDDSFDALYIVVIAALIAVSTSVIIMIRRSRD